MTNFKIIRQIFYQFLIIISVALVFELIYKGLKISSFYNTIENILFSVLLLSPLYLISYRKIQSVYIYFVYLFFCLCIYFETVYYYLFDTFLSASSLFVSLESNRSEAIEFLNFYFDTKVIIFSVILFIIVALSVYRLTSNLNHFNNQSKRALIRVSICVGIVVAFLKFSALIVYNLPYLILKSSTEYALESNKLGNYKTNSTGDFTNVSRPVINEDEVYVVVLGESTSRAHFGLYNYYRATTPKLTSIKNQLSVYNDVISAHPHSITSITKLLTLGNYENPDKIGDGSIVQLANSAGFETTWLSNQRPIGVYESLVTKIALSSSRTNFLTTIQGVHNKVMDGALLPELETILANNSSSKKLIIIHLMGTHVNYVNRYPEDFNTFTDTPLSNYKSNKIFKTINHYDNAVLYTDYVVSQIIQKIKTLNKKSFVLYFSDHGEELFKDYNMAGHNEDISTKDMYDVPFLLWQSENFKEHMQLESVVDRPYMLDDLFHSLADLLEISAQEVDLERSIFSSKFKKRKRIILKNSEYDTYFNLD